MTLSELMAGLGGPEGAITDAPIDLRLEDENGMAITEDTPLVEAYVKVKGGRLVLVGRKPRKRVRRVKTVDLATEMREEKLFDNLAEKYYSK